MKFSLKWRECLTALLASFFLSIPCQAATVVSDGSDGPFVPVGSLYTVDLPEDGVFNFTTIHIPAGVTVKFNRNPANTPVFFGATGDVVIDGTLDVSATATDTLLPPVPENPKQSAGPGGFDGGSGGTASATVGQDGNGLGGGGAGYSAGGAGNALPGSQPTRYSTDGGKGDAGPAVDFTTPLAGGSGGGGGSARYRFGWYNGGYGGGGGGAIRIVTPGQITINGSILANGANGGWAHASVLAHGGAGGGGSGGNIALVANTVTLDEAGQIQALGGYGGGLSTQPYSHDPAAYSSGGNGGLGYVMVQAVNMFIDGPMEPIMVTPCEADTNGDGTVDSVDLGAFANDFGKIGCGSGTGCVIDSGLDDDVDGIDLLLLTADMHRSDCP